MQQIQAYRDAAKESFRLLRKLCREAQYTDFTTWKELEKEERKYIKEMDHNNECAVSLLLENNVYSKDGKGKLEILFKKNARMNNERERALKFFICLTYSNPIIFMLQGWRTTLKV